MKVSEAKEKVCPIISTGFAADVEGLRDGKSAIKINCIGGECMFWEFTNTHKEESTVTCHRCYEKVSTSRDTCSRCDAFIRGYGAKIPLVELDEDEKEGYCKRLDQ